MDVCVLGAGIVGLSTAYALAERGFSVTVVEQGGVGSGASSGNGAQLSYSYVQPLANAALWAQLPSLLFSRHSPLTLHPQFDLQQWRWCIAFLRACRADIAAQTTAQLLELALESKVAFEDMLAKERLDCDYSCSGKIVLYPDARSLVTAQLQVELQRKLGSAQTVVSRSDACVIEPALANHKNRIAGAVYTASEAAVDSLKLCLELARVLRARGVQFILGETIDAFQMHRNRITAVRTSKGLTEATNFVMALGVGSVALARSVGIRLPIYPLKGYSLTLDVAAALDKAPRVSVTDSASKVVFARIGDRLRVAGMLELAGDNYNIRSSAIFGLQQSAASLFPALASCTAMQTWAGLRPATPTALPILGVQAGGPINLLMNTGHGALGLTLAFGSAHRACRALLQLV